MRAGPSAAALLEPAGGVLAGVPGSLPSTPDLLGGSHSIDLTQGTLYPPYPEEVVKSPNQMCCCRTAQPGMVTKRVQVDRHKWNGCREMDTGGMRTGEWTQGGGCRRMDASLLGYWALLLDTHAPQLLSTLNSLFSHWAFSLCLPTKAALHPKSQLSS